MDYSEDTKWGWAKTLLYKFESSPELYGPSLLEIDPTNTLNNISIYELPDDLDKKISFYKDKYWGTARELTSRLSTIYFILLCTFGEKASKKILLHTILSVPCSMLTPEYTLVDINNTDAIIALLNKLNKIYGEACISQYISASTHKVVDYILTTNNFGDIYMLWKLRTKLVM